MTNCEIVQDLLPLYKDEVVSASSIEMIEEHLKTCQACQAELDKLQGEVKVSYSPEQKAEVGAFKLLKKRILKRNVIIACTSIVLAVALLLGVYLYLDNNIAIIPYTDGLIVDISAYPDRGIFDIVSSIKPGSWNICGMAIKEDNEIVKLVFINFSESTLSKWQNNRGGTDEYSFQIMQPLGSPTLKAEDDDPLTYNYLLPFDRCEIYYTNENLSKLNYGENYQRLRSEGVLLASGTFEDFSLVAYKSYGLENATDRQRMDKMITFSLYKNGTMSFAPALISSYIPPRCTYSIEGDEMVFRARIKTERDRQFFGLEDGAVVARFTIIDENTLVFSSAEIALFAEPNGRYVAVYPDVNIEAVPVYDLTNSGKFTSNAEGISNFRLYTNSTKISVSVSGDITSENAYITLYDADVTDGIAVMQISPDRQTGAFSNLTAAKNYYVIAIGLDGCEITLSD